ncbi:MAG: aminomethyl-transferring glycine dehydrogenase, partial [Lachnospiraceae bacterium]
SAMGKDGISSVAAQSMSKAHYMAEQLSGIGYETVNKGTYFNEFVTTSKAPVGDVMAALETHKILGGLPLDGDREGQILWCCTEMNTKEEIDQVVSILKEV